MPINSSAAACTVSTTMIADGSDSTVKNGNKPLISVTPPGTSMSLTAESISISPSHLILLAPTPPNSPMTPRSLAQMIKQQNDAGVMPPTFKRPRIDNTNEDDSIRVTEGKEQHQEDLQLLVKDGNHNNLLRMVCDRLLLSASSSQILPPLVDDNSAIMSPV